MSGHLRPLTVRSGIVDITRDWKAWLEPLDDIPVNPRAGISGLMTSNVHWLCLTRRSDLPLDVTATSASGDDIENPAPGDIVVMAKEYMSSPGLHQAAFAFCRAGASNRLPHPVCPPAWCPRFPFTDKDHREAQRFGDKVLRLLPERAAAVQYMRDWMAKDVLPSEAPAVPKILLHRYAAQTAGDAIGLVLERATVQGTVSAPKLLQVKRRKVSLQGNSTLDVPLPSYVAFRECQGIPTMDAVQEWNGNQRLLRERARLPGDTALATAASAPGDDEPP